MKKILAALAAAAALDSGAVSLSPDGTGQALVFPYYTVRSVGPNAFNTYVSIVNHTQDAKALRVRFREGRLSRETLSFNLFLGPGDAWVGAVVPQGSGTRLLSPDASCTDPPFRTDLVPISLPYLDFRTEQFSDDAGSSIDRTQEGFIEVLEMAVLTGAHAAAATLTGGTPGNCPLLRNATTLETARPGGGLSGTLTLINVTGGSDFTVNADALADLASNPYYRPANDPYPDFNAGEIDAVSDQSVGGVFYRSRWPRPVDAVSAVFMRNEWGGEYVLDALSTSLTDFVVTFPTRHFYAGATGALPPFQRPATWRGDCDSTDGPGGVVSIVVRDREGAPTPPPPPGPIGPQPIACASAAVVSVRNGSDHMPESPLPSGVLGSTTGGLAAGGIPAIAFTSGSVHLSMSGSHMVSLPHSSRWTPQSSEKNGAHTFDGLPVTGFSVRTFANGTLDCGPAKCQGNYGGAFPLRYRRSVMPDD